MTEAFGPCGIGWKYQIERLWTEKGDKEVVFAFAQISLFIKFNGEWSEPIPGIGGNMLLAMERGGLHNNDEAYKMAVTDALSVAMKALGVAADIYAGMWDGERYINEKEPEVIVISAEAQAWIDKINKKASNADLLEVGLRLANEDPDVQNMVRPFYEKRAKAIKENK